MPENTNNENTWLNAEYEIADGVVRALKAWARSKPWRGSLAQRRNKVHHAHVMLGEAMGVSGITLNANQLDDESPCSLFSGAVAEALEHGDSEALIEAANGEGDGITRFDTASNTIFLCGKLSVVTYLRLLAEAAGMNHGDRIRFAVNGFARGFPRSFARSTVLPDGTIVKRDADATPDPEPQDDDDETSQQD